MTYSDAANAEIARLTKEREHAVISFLALLVGAAIGYAIGAVSRQ